MKSPGLLILGTGRGQAFCYRRVGFHIRFWLRLYQYDLTWHDVAEFLPRFFDDGVSVALQLEYPRLKFLTLLIVSLNGTLQTLIFGSLGAPFNHAVCTEHNFVSDQDGKHA